MEPLRRRLVPASPEEAERGAAMVMVLMLMLVVASLGILITASVVQQVRPTLFLQKSVRTLSAAETGLDAALSQIRTATAAADASGTVYGSLVKLPCQLTGTVGSAGQGGAYAVDVTYFTEDPTSKDASWRTANQLPCSATAGVSTTPRFAVLDARGTGPAAGGSAAAVGDRDLQSIYTFQLTNANVSGGLLYDYGRGTCVQADSATEGAAVHYVDVSKCSPRQGLQLWQWDTDYRIRLSTSTAAGVTQLCLTGAFSGTADVTLRQCSNARYDQLFSYDDQSRFRGQNSTNTDYSDNCLGTGQQGSASAGMPLRSVQGCWSVGAMDPEPTFGAGAAGYRTNQIVNYQQFGRCFDITNQNVNSANEIVYPCKQDPSGQSRFSWNHKIYYQEGVTTPQQVTVVKDGTTYCLTTPSRDQAQPAYPRLYTCTSGSVSQQWVRTGEVTGNYAASYTFTDTYGRCMGIGPLTSGWSSVVVVPCDGSASQKWNAPPNAVAASVKGFREDVRGS